MASFWVRFGFVFPPEHEEDSPGAAFRLDLTHFLQNRSGRSWHLARASELGSFCKFTFSRFPVSPIVQKCRSPGSARTTSERGARTSHASRYYRSAVQHRSARRGALTEIRPHHLPRLRSRPGRCQDDRPAGSRSFTHAVLGAIDWAIARETFRETHSGRPDPWRSLRGAVPSTTDRPNRERTRTTRPGQGRR